MLGRLWCELVITVGRFSRSRTHLNARQLTSLPTRFSDCAGIVADFACRPVGAMVEQDQVLRTRRALAGALASGAGVTTTSTQTTAGKIPRQKIIQNSGCARIFAAIRASQDTSVDARAAGTHG